MRRLRRVPTLSPSRTWGATKNQDTPCYHVQELVVTKRHIALHLLHGAPETTMSSTSKVTDGISRNSAATTAERPRRCAVLRTARSRAAAASLLAPCHASPGARSGLAATGAPTGGGQC